MTVQEKTLDFNIAKISGALYNINELNKRTERKAVSECKDRKIHYPTPRAFRGERGG